MVQVEKLILYEGSVDSVIRAMWDRVVIWYDW